MKKKDCAGKKGKTTNKKEKRKGITELIMMVGFLLIFALAIITLIYIVMQGKDVFTHAIKNIKTLVGISSK